MKFIKFELRQPDVTKKGFFNMELFSHVIISKTSVQIDTISNTYCFSFTSNDKALEFYTACWQVITGDMTLVVLEDGYVLRCNDEQ